MRSCLLSPPGTRGSTGMWTGSVLFRLLPHSTLSHTSSRASFQAGFLDKRKSANAAERCAYGDISSMFFPNPPCLLCLPPPPPCSGEKRLGSQSQGVCYQGGVLPVYGIPLRSKPYLRGKDRGLAIEFVVLFAVLKERKK